VEGVVFWTVVKGRTRRATVQNTIPDTERQLFDCSWNNCFITWSNSTFITVLTILAKEKSNKKIVLNLIFYLCHVTSSLLSRSMDASSGNPLWRQWRQSTRVKQSKLLTGQQFANVDVFRMSKKKTVINTKCNLVSGNNLQYCSSIKF
jgi:hypothetical protein